MTKPWLFLSDIDGTLVRGEIGLAPGVIAAARAYTAAGGLLAVCTGRAPVSALPVAQALGTNAPCVLYGGAALFDRAQNAVLWSRPFAPEVRSGIAGVLSALPGVSVQAFTQREIYVLRRNRRFNERGVREENTGPIRTLDQVEGPILKLVLCSDNRAELETCRPFFPEETCQFAFSSRNFVDIVAAGAGKEAAMAALSRQLDIPLSRFFCAGDGMTDLPMLQLAGYSYAPANALEPVRQAVDRVVPDVADGGMEQAFRHAADFMNNEV